MDPMDPMDPIDDLGGVGVESSFLLDEKSDVGRVLSRSVFPARPIASEFNEP